MALVWGDVVLVRVKAFGQDHKIMDRWDQNPHIVVSQMGDEPIFKVQAKDAKDKEGIGILHWNVLYPNPGSTDWCTGDNRSIIIDEYDSSC